MPPQIGGRGIHTSASAWCRTASFCAPRNKRRLLKAPNSFGPVRPLAGQQTDRAVALIFVIAREGHMLARLGREIRGLPVSIPVAWGPTHAPLNWVPFCTKLQTGVGPPCVSTFQAPEIS